VELRIDLVDRKLNTINTVIKNLEANSKVKHRIGGTTNQNVNLEIEFQTKRKELLEWAKSVTYEEVEAKKEELEGTLTSEELNCKYGTVKGLTNETQNTIAYIEDLEIALGIHPIIKELGV